MTYATSPWTWRQHSTRLLLEFSIAEVPVTSIQNYRFVWKRATQRRWYAKNLTAKSPEEAVRRMASHLKALGPLDQFEVDHLFYRDKEVGLVEARMLYEAENLTLLKMAAPFHIVFRNQTWTPGAYPEYPASSIDVAN